MKLPRYRCHKVVEALKIAEGGVIHSNGQATLCFQDAGFKPMRVKHNVIARYLPMPGDYLVIYGDGYQSISPGKVFEEGYTIIDNEESE